MADHKQELGTIQRFLTFYVQDEQYGIDISRIKEIIAPINITHIPNTPNYLKGVINLRGSIIPVVDIRLKFGLEERDMDMNTAIVIYEVTNASIGFIVDRIDDVISLDKSHISEAPHFGNNIDTSFIENVAEVNKDVVMLLNLEKIFDAQELENISELETEEK